MAMNLEFDNSASRIRAGNTAGQNLFAFTMRSACLEADMVFGTLSCLAEAHRKFWYRLDGEWFEVNVIEPGLVRIDTASPFERWRPALRAFIERTDKAIAWLSK